MIFPPGTSTSPTAEAEGAFPDKLLNDLMSEERLWEGLNPHLPIDQQKNLARALGVMLQDPVKRARVADMIRSSAVQALKAEVIKHQDGGIIIENLYT